MRKIEIEMNRAIQNNIDWQKDNTSVHFDPETGVSIVRLHGSKIAEVTDTDMTIFDGGYQSNTTKSRLNALITEFCNAVTDGVFQKNYQWFVRDNNEVKQFNGSYTFAWSNLMNKNNTKTREQIQEEYIEWDLNQMTEEDLRDFFIVTQNRELNDLDDDELVEDVKQYAPHLVENITLSISWIMNTITSNIIDRDELQRNYVQEVIDGLDLKDCMAMLYDYLSNDMDKLTLSELIEDVEEYYPHLLEDN